MFENVLVKERYTFCCQTLFLSHLDWRSLQRSTEVVPLANDETLVVVREENPTRSICVCVVVNRTLQMKHEWCWSLHFHDGGGYLEMEMIHGGCCPGIHRI